MHCWCPAVYSECIAGDERVKIQPLESGPAHRDRLSSSKADSITHCVLKVCHSDVGGWLGPRSGGCGMHNHLLQRTEIKLVTESICKINDCTIAEHLHIHKHWAGARHEQTDTVDVAELCQDG